MDHNNTFGILPRNGEDEILNQLHTLMELSLQNQVAIQKIMNALEKQGVNMDYKGKGRLYQPITRENSNPFGVDEDDD
jgi:hypothetical protein